MEEKEAYPFEKEYKDCACVVGVVYICYRQLFFSLSRGERERPYLFFRLFAACSLSVKSLALFFWSTKRFKPTMDLIRVHNVKFFLKSYTRRVA
jgi:hypothetical protein